MQDFGSFVYLDMPKTGSWYVVTFLKQVSRIEEKAFARHRWVGQTYNPKAFHFISVRNPVSLYNSLYRYGLDKKGGVYNRLKDSRNLQVYRDFDYFCSFALDPANARLLDTRYDQTAAEQCGFMSFRYLRLCLQNPDERIAQQLAGGKALSHLKADFIIDHVVRTENLNDDLLSLTTEIIPEYFDPEQVRLFLESMPKINVSYIPADQVQLADGRMRDRILEKEHLLAAHYC